MKTTRNALFALLLLAAGTVTAAQAQVSIGAGLHIGPSGRAAGGPGVFCDNPAPYGNWIQRPNYGWVWAPTAVSTAWRPYENGHWVWTDQGWTWITVEPYGWATYHYGRWYQDPQIGWAWVPGNDWVRPGSPGRKAPTTSVGHPCLRASTSAPAITAATAAVMATTAAATGATTTGSARTPTSSCPSATSCR